MTTFHFSFIQLPHLSVLPLPTFCLAWCKQRPCCISFNSGRDKALPFKFPSMCHCKSFWNSVCIALRASDTPIAGRRADLSLHPQLALCACRAPARLINTTTFMGFSAKKINIYVYTQYIFFKVCATYQSMERAFSPHRDASRVRFLCKIEILLLTYSSIYFKFEILDTAPFF